jgi:P-type conjugative transfer protein TrbJ
MRRVMSRISYLGALAVLPAALLMMPLQEAKAQFVVSDPGTETNTMLTHVTQLLQYIKDVQMALSTLQQATMMAREVQQLVTHPSTNIAADLAMFSNVLSQSQGLALNLAQMDVTFRNQFAPFSPSPLVNYAAQYNTWATTALGAVRGAANSAGYQGNMLQNEQQWMSQVNMMNQQPNGMDQSIQLTNSIGLETVAQLQKMRMLMIQNIGSNAAFTTTQLNMQQTGQQAQANAFTFVPIQADQRGW